MFRRIALQVRTVGRPDFMVASTTAAATAATAGILVICKCDAGEDLVSFPLSVWRAPLCIDSMAQSLVYVTLGDDFVYVLCLAAFY